jgi:hypothetical protein
MTTSLHMTSVDMLEFGEAAVRLFVDAAYSGTAEGITRDTFRDINKIASVFEMTWLVGKCAEYFTEVVDSVKTPSYADLLYLFEEAGFVFETLKTKDFLNLTIKKIEMLQGKQEFIDRYLENADRLSTQKLDMVIELAGTEVHCVVQTLTNQLSEKLKVDGPCLPIHHEYLLDNSDLSFCKISDRVLFDKLFDILGSMSDDKMRWVFQLHRKSLKREAEVLQNSPESSDTTTVSRCNSVPNLYHDLDMNMTFDELLLWISTSETVTNILMAIEAVWTWNRYRYYRTTVRCYKVDFSALIELLRVLIGRRGWSYLPSQFTRFHVYFITSPKRLNLFCLGRFCQYHNDEVKSTFININSVETCNEPLSLLSKESKLTFHFMHPSVSTCNLSGECGFILKTVPSEAALWTLRLCTDLLRGKIT